MATQGRRRFIGTALAIASAGPAYADIANTAAGPKSWLAPELLAAARAEGSVTIYSAVNEQEALPFWQVFQDATGIKVNYVRASENQIAGRIAIEHRAGSHSWDLVGTTTVMLLPATFLADLHVPEAAHILPSAVGANGKWYGVYANYNTPSYNTKLVSAVQLPKNYEGFLAHPEWTGKLAIDGSDTVWLKGFFQRFGDAHATDLLTRIVKILKPVVVDGHLALARSVAAGEYIGALNNYSGLTLNQQLAGGPTDNIVLDPVILSFGQVGMSSQAPHPNAGILAMNYMLSVQGQTAMAAAGRIPVRKDISSALATAINKLQTSNVVTVTLSSAEEKVWKAKFQQIFAQV